MSSVNFSSAVSKVCNQWHAKLGHPPLNILRLVMNKVGIPCSQLNLSFCDSCKLGKMHQLPFENHSITAKSPLELAYSDLWGPAFVLSTKGFLYYIVFIDAYTWYTWLYPLRLKLDALAVFKAFHKLAELQFNSKLKALQTDNGGEFKTFLLYLNNCGIQP